MKNIHTRYPSINNPGTHPEEKSEFFKFVIKHKCDVNNKRKRNEEECVQKPNIYRMEGGLHSRLYIPDDIYEEFLAAYMNSINNGYIFSLSEQRSDVFKLFFDLDISYREGMSKNMALAITRCVQNSVKKFYVSIDENSNLRTFSAFVSIRGGKFVDEDDESGLEYLLETSTDVDEEEMNQETKTTYCEKLTSIYECEPNEKTVKCGIHINFHYLYVKSEQALTIRETVICDLISQFGPRIGHAPWKEVVDKEVFRKNGLSLLYSHKLKACKCRNSDEQNIQNTCHLKTRPKNLPECPYGCYKTWFKSPPYKPVFVLKNDGTEEHNVMKKFCEDPFLALICCSIRCPLETMVTKGYEVYPLAPRPLENDMQISNLVKSMINVYDSSIITEVQNFIQNSFDKYSKIRIKKICYRVLKRGNNNVYFIVNVDHPSIGSSYCYNVNRDHKSSSIYFKIFPEGITQCCFSNKHNCHNYNSPMRKLGDLLKKKLFFGIARMPKACGSDTKLSFNNLDDVNLVKLALNQKIKMLESEQI